VVAGLLEKVEKIFTRNVLEGEEIRLSLESAIKSDDIWVSRESLMNSGLRGGRG
jgi:hypothetical protein